VPLDRSFPDSPRCIWEGSAPPYPLHSPPLPWGCRPQTHRFSFGGLAPPRPPPPSLGAYRSPDPSLYSGGLRLRGSPPSLRGCRSPDPPLDFGGRAELKMIFCFAAEGLVRFGAEVRRNFAGGVCWSGFLTIYGTPGRVVPEYRRGPIGLRDLLGR
jgi:hypothetical protein